MTRGLQCCGVAVLKQTTKLYVFTASGLSISMHVNRDDAEQVARRSWHATASHHLQGLEGICQQMHQRRGRKAACINVQRHGSTGFTSTADRSPREWRAGAGGLLFLKTPGGGGGGPPALRQKDCYHDKLS